jgi:pimeloyl-ACP methyl ester carboxylesterase
MPQVLQGDLEVAYEIVGKGRPWVITPGGRFSKDYRGVREMALALANHGNKVLIYDRLNCGESAVCFSGASESEMQADSLAQLIREINFGPAVMVGGAGGSRVAMLTAARHPDVASGLAVWWITGGVFGLNILGSTYCGGSLSAAWDGEMDDVAKLPEWREVVSRNPRNRERFLSYDRHDFIATMERWMHSYCGCDTPLVPGFSDLQARSMVVPTLVFRSGMSDIHHPRAVSERIAATLPNATIVDPPWGDREWRDREAGMEEGSAPDWMNPTRQVFERWPLLVPQLVEWSGIAIE